MSLLNNKRKIRAIIYHKNRQVTIKKLKPESRSFDYDNQSYIIDKENYYIYRGVAIYSYLEQVPTPIALKNLQVAKNKTETIPLEDVMISAEELNIFKKSKSAKEVLNSIEKSSPEGLLSVISIGVTVLGIGLLYFILQEQITTLTTQLQELVNLLGG